MLEFGLKICGLPAQRKLVSAACHAHSNDHTTHSNVKVRVAILLYSIYL